MKAWLKKIQPWRLRRQQRSLERWEQIRAEGKKRFVFRTALTYGLTVVGANHFFDHVFGEIQPSISLVKLIFYVLVGILIGSEAWSNREAKYQKALHEARVKALPESKNSPASRA